MVLYVGYEMITLAGTAVYKNSVKTAVTLQYPHIKFL